MSVTDKSHKADDTVRRIQVVDQSVQGMKELWEDLPPIHEKKSPVVAGIIGFLAGGVGLGLYFKSWRDAIYPVIAFGILTALLPWGPGELAGAIFACLWGVIRAHDKTGLPRAAPTAVPPDENP